MTAGGWEAMIGVDQVEVADQIGRRGMLMVDGDGCVEIAADQQQLQPLPLVLKQLRDVRLKHGIPSR